MEVDNAAEATAAVEKEVVPLSSLAVEAGLEEKGAADAEELEDEMLRGRKAIGIMCATFKIFLQKVKDTWATLGHGEYSAERWDQEGFKAIDSVIGDLEWDQTRAIVASSKDDPLFEEYIKHMLQLTEDDWVYGCEDTSDPAEDLKGFAIWHVARKLQYPAPEPIDPFPPAPAAPTQPESATQQQAADDVTMPAIDALQTADAEISEAMDVEKSEAEV